jgi:uncharacterized protein (TIGR00251 family)
MPFRPAGAGRTRRPQRNPPYVCSHQTEGGEQQGTTHGFIQMKKSKSAPPSSTRKRSEIDSFCAWDGETLVLNVLGKPSASKDAIGKPKGRQLNISVTEAPVAGRATDHMVRFLAEAFGVAVKDIEVVFGRFNVNKQLRIRSPRQLPAVIRKHLSETTAVEPSKT